MRFTACACKPEHYRRGHRPGWLKLVTSRSLYHCYCCSAVLLLPPPGSVEPTDSPSPAARLADLHRAFDAPLIAGNEKPA